MRATKQKPRRYWLRLATFFFTILIVALACLPFALGTITTIGLLYLPCQGGEPNPADYGYTWEDVAIKASTDGEFRAFFISGTNGATIIVPPPLAGPRGSRWAETQLLLKHGYSVLSLESRRCAGMGSLSLGYKEVNEVGDALTYLQRRPDVDPNRIGIHGFSSAGATSIMATARYPQLKAVVAEGGYGDFQVDSFGGPDNGLDGYVERGYRWSFPVVYKAITGLDLAVLSPESVIDQINPRPILLIYGSNEVSLNGARRQKAAAGDNADLWIVEGAGHGNYYRVAPKMYEERLINFFDQTIGPSNPAP